MIPINFILKFLDWVRRWAGYPVQGQICGIPAVEEAQMDNRNLTLVDRIFALSDDVICEIFSKLERREMVRFCVISRGDIRRVWRSIPVSLEFKESPQESPTSTDRIEFFSRLFEELHYWVPGKIGELFLQLKDYEVRIKDKIDFVLWFASSAKLTKLSVKFLDIAADEEAYEVSPVIFYNRGLLHLELVNCVINPNFAVQWLKLVSLLVSQIAMSANTIQRILEGAPNLEFLTLDRVNGLSHLNITSEKLVKLVLYCYEMGPDTLFITAPHVEALELWGVAYHHVPWVMTDELQSLKTGVLSFSADFLEIENPHIKSRTEADFFNSIFGSLKQAEKLELDYWPSQCVSVMAYKEFQSNNLKVLKLLVSKRRGTHHGALRLMDGCPSLERIIINFTSLEPVFFAENTYGDYYHLPSLCHIEVANISRGNNISPSVIELLRCILRDAPLLSRLVIRGPYRASDVAGYHQTIRDLATASPALEIEFL